MKEFKKYSPVIVLVLIVVSFILLFVEPGMTATVLGLTGDAKASAFELIFGMKDVIQFNILGLVQVLLIVVGAVLPYVDKKNKNLTLLAALLLIIGGTLLYITPSTIKLNNNPFGNLAEYKPASPMIVSSVASILAGIVNGISYFETN